MTQRTGARGASHKARLSKGQKLLRLLGSVLDPRAWAHVVKIVNYYNYSHVQPLRAITLGPGANISPNVAFANPERITIGARVRLGVRCVLWAGPGTGRIVIGDDVMFGPEVMLTASSYRYNDGHPVTNQAMDEADIVIGNDVWIGTRAVLLPGARIGDGAIIGAHAVVRGEIPAMAIAVGSPARVVSQRQIGTL
ncbi:Acetyltransferase (isoleucine patch superfamily) [Loktanella atrilutea]|uniref:Acetyltransferase (Isoleucine patch superfamily) n=1 Tax=Loktanella atrilutea TaxID=366533 RepID=A0A1M5F4D0_LOKAT|nr:acyltransferase [Loktanella atrilutea]SHF86325.1 Acetyltransferase (isoleucine patch superfamily) [Loktanella atrilutea]